MNYSIGIDLGTTYSCAGIWRNGKVEIIPNQIGNRITPSVVSFFQEKRFIGEAGKKIITKNYQNTVYDVKRLIGRNFNDKEVQEDMKLWPFKVENGTNDKPMIVVEYKKEQRSFAPEQISAMILERLKEDAETFLGQKINDAVITVPAYFNISQRQATIDAARIAGLNVKELINEPVAAAIAYGLENNLKKKKNICVFDLGGGTFDVTILEIDNKIFTVKAIGGDSHLGGEDFDNELVKYCIEKFKEENDIDISNDQKALRRLKLACEQAKIELSSMNYTAIDIDSLSDGEDLNFDIDRKEFENICETLFEKCLNCLIEVIKESKLEKNEINDIVLIGGSSRIPKIRNIILDFFENNVNIYKTVNPDESVAYGAAIISFLDNENEKNNLPPIELINVCPLSLGICVKDGKMSVLIPKNTQIPVKIKKVYRNAHDNQKEASIKVYEGENELCEKNTLLDEFTIDIRKALKDDVKIEVTFEIDKNSILNVYAKDDRNKKND